MATQKCPKCSSRRIRLGYRPTPFLLKVIFRYNLLCNDCNWEFTGFAIPATVPKKNRRKKSIGNAADSNDVVTNNNFDLNKNNSLELSENKQNTIENDSEKNNGIINLEEPNQESAAKEFISKKIANKIPLNGKKAKSSEEKNTSAGSVKVKKRVRVKLH